MDINSYFNNMEMDFIALESSILNFEVTNDINTVALEGNNAVMFEEIPVDQYMNRMSDRQFNQFQKAINIAQDITANNFVNATKSTRALIHLTKSFQNVVILNQDIKAHQIREELNYPLIKIKPSCRKAYDHYLDKNAFQQIASYLADMINESFYRQNIHYARAYANANDQFGDILLLRYTNSSTESATSDYPFGFDLFEENVATEFQQVPAIESVGEKIGNALKAIFNALKRFFKKLLELFSKPFKASKKPKPEVEVFLAGKNGEKRASTMFSDSKSADKFIHVHDEIAKTRLSAIKIIMNFMGTTHSCAKKIIISINTIFDNIRQHSVQEPIQNPEDMARRIHTHDERGYDNKILIGGKNTVEECVAYKDKIKAATKQIGTAFTDGVKQIKTTSQESEADIAKKLKNFLVLSLSFGNVSNVFSEITVSMRDACKENLDFCDHMVEYCNKTLDTQKDANAQAGFVLCKYYSTISHCYQDFAVCIKTIENGQCYSLQS